MAKLPELIGGFPRRTLLATSSAAAGALFTAACGPFAPFPKDQPRSEAPRANEALIVQLRQDLGITPTTTRSAFGEHLARLALNNPAWMVGRTIEYMSEQGKVVRYEIDQRGEPNPLIAQTYDVECSDPRDEGKPYARNVDTFRNNRYLAIYADEETAGRLRQKQSIMESFVAEYFGDAKATSVLHMIFLPRASRLELHDIGNLIKVYLGAVAARENTAVEAKTGAVRRVDVIVSMPVVYLDALNKATPLTATLAGTLVNEMTGFLIRQALPAHFRGTQYSESFSTLTQTLTELDEQAARMLLGGIAYKEFTKVVAEETVKVCKELLRK